ncbi:MAG: hypothetical protein JXP34_25110 [Planctomycetes bacterium]|nr:hypothetical protein [Planctomycetota bacterium]
MTRDSQDECRLEPARAADGDTRAREWDSPFEPGSGFDGARRSNRFWFLATVLVFAGLILVAENYEILPGAHRFWPVFPSILGLGFLALALRRRPADPMLFGLGILILCLSALFFFCSFAGWSILSRFWPVFIGILGIALLSASPWGRDRRFLATIGTVLVLLSAVFLLVVTVDARLWPLSFVVTGASLYLLGRNTYGTS